MMWNWLVSSLAVGRDGRAVRRRAAQRRRRSSGTWRSRSGSPCSAPAPSTWPWPRRRGSGRAEATTSARCARCSPPGARSRRAATTTCTATIKRGRAPRQHQRRDRHHLLLRPRRSHRPGVARRAADPRTGDGGRGVRRAGRPVRERDGRAGLHPSVSQHAGRVLGRSRRLQVPRARTSSVSRACGATATGPGSPRTTA